MTDERRSLNKGILYTLITCLVSSIVTGIVCIVYTGIIDRESNQRWCNAVVAIDDAFRSSPNTSQSSAAKRIADAYSKLRKEFEC